MGGAMKRQEPKRWEVERYVFQNEPYRLKLLDDQKSLEEKLLAFCESPRTGKEIVAMLGERTDCPEDRLKALQYTLMERLRARGAGRWMDDTFARGERPHRYFTTELGKQELARRLAARESALAAAETMQGVGQ